MGKKVLFPHPFSYGKATEKLIEQKRQTPRAPENVDLEKKN